MAPRHISYRLLRRRMRRTCYYGQHRVDQLSMPLTSLFWHLLRINTYSAFTESATAYFAKHSPYDNLDEQFATSLSR
jgi:hypothetical protein